MNPFPPAPPLPGHSPFPVQGIKPPGSSLLSRLLPTLVLAAIGLVWLAMKTGPDFLRHSAAAILPPCLFHEITGFSCPGCGGTRAWMASLDGRWAEAFRFNPLLPLGLLAIAAESVKNHFFHSTPLPSSPALRSLIVYQRGFAAFAIIFTILRNMPLPAH